VIQILRCTFNCFCLFQEFPEIFISSLELDFINFSIVEMVNRTVLALRGSIDAKKIIVSISISENLPKRKFRGDKHKIEHVLSNLLSNAIKFSPDDSKITISVDCMPIEGRAVECAKLSHSITFSVKDNGCGIALEDQHLLFHSWSQIRPGELQQVNAYCLL